MVRLLLILALVGFASPALGVPMYRVDFSGPLHQAGQPPTRAPIPALPRLGPTHFTAGSPEIASSVGDLDGQAAVLNAGTPQLEKMAFLVGLRGAQYRIAFDFYPDAFSPSNPTNSSFGFFLQLDNFVPVLRIQDDSRMRVFPSGSGAIDVGGFELRQKMHIETLVDRETGDLQLFVDGSSIFSGTGRTFDQLGLVTMGIQDLGRGTRIGIDNVEIDTVPEPASALLVGLGLVGLATRRRLAGSASVRRAPRGRRDRRSD
jgi:hypothetical protein